MARKGHFSLHESLVGINKKNPQTNRPKGFEKANDFLT